MVGRSLQSRRHRVSLARPCTSHRGSLLFLHRDAATMRLADSTVAPAWNPRVGPTEIKLRLRRRSFNLINDQWLYCLFDIDTFSNLINSGATRILHRDNAPITRLEVDPGLKSERAG